MPAQRGQHIRVDGRGISTRGDCVIACGSALLLSTVCQLSFQPSRLSRPRLPSPLHLSRWRHRSPGPGGTEGTRRQENQRMVEWFGLEGMLKAISLQPTAVGRDTFNYSRLLQVPSDLTLGTPRDGEMSLLPATCSLSPAGRGREWDGQKPQTTCGLEDELGTYRAHIENIPGKIRG